MRSCFALALLAAASEAFYLPGVAPRTFRYGDKVRKIILLTSYHIHTIAHTRVLMTPKI